MKPTAQEVAEMEAELVRVEQDELRSKLRTMPYRRAIEWADTEDKLRAVARARGYHRGWVRHRLARPADAA